MLPVPGRQDQARGRQGRPRSLKLLARDTVNKGSSSLHSRLENQELGRRQSRNYGSDQANEEMTRPWQKKHLKELLVRVPSANSGPVIVPVPIS